MIIPPMPPIPPSQSFEFLNDVYIKKLWCKVYFLRLENSFSDKDSKIFADNAVNSFKSTFKEV